MANYSYTQLDSLLTQVRRIEEHRIRRAEAQIKKTYQGALGELRHYLADTYTKFAENDQLTFGILQKHGYYARFLEEVEKKINTLSPQVKRLIRSTVAQTYETTYNGFVETVKKAAGGRMTFDGLKGCTPDVVRRAVENPIAGLTLNDRLEKNRKEIVHEIKKNITVGLTNGDRYTTMANRVKQSVDGSYRKAIRITRTEIHRVRQAGEWDSAMETDKQLQESGSGMRIEKTWKTMRDERVRPAKRYKTKKGWKTGKQGKYDHKAMEGVSCLVDEEFTLPSGATTQYPGGSGIAGEDINCRCYLSYKLKKVEQINLLDENAMKLPDDIMKINGITEDDRIELEKAITIMQKRYDIQIGETAVESFGKSERGTYFIAGPYLEKGKLKMGLAINQDIDYTKIRYIVKKRYESGFFASKTLEDCMKHEMAHIMTFQGCKTYEEYKKLYAEINKAFIPGISGYADRCQDGVEMLAEAFVRIQNGERVPIKARLLVKKYIERWRK